MRGRRQGTLVKDVGPRDHVQGPADAPVTLLEYGDYQCPYCGAAHPIVKALQRHLGDNLRFAFRHFPLATIHEYAEGAAEAAEAAGAQGKFWQMHDTLFENQPALDIESLVGYAEELGLDVERFATEMENQVYAPRVREDFISGIRSGVNGTPTFFINGARHEGTFDFETMLEAIQARMQGLAA
jgi:protein-disulfide isomerase